MAVNLALPAVVKEALENQRFASNSETALRVAELDDLKFDALDQWPADIIAQRAGDESKRIPARPCEVFNLLGQPISQIDNTQEQAAFSPVVKGKNGKGSKANAEAAQGILRDIQNRSHAPEARMWGAKRANRCGRGYWRIVSKYVDDPDVTGAAAHDQHLVVKSILNQFTVYADPTAKEPNKRDARWWLITDAVTESDLIRRFGKEKAKAVTSTGAEDWADIGTTYPGWQPTDDKGTRTFRIAEYIRLEDVLARTVLECQRGDITKFFTIEKGETVKAPNGWKELSRREIKTKKVKWDIVSAVNVLYTQEWPGQHLPIVEMVVEEKNVDGVRITQGMIRPAKGAQRSYNYIRNKQIETIGLAPVAPIMAESRAIAAYKNIYDNANVNNYSVLPYDSIDSDGNPIQDARPMREVPEPAIQAVTMAVQAAAGDVRATTMVPEVSLGQTDPRYRAKGSILALQGQSELATSGFLMSFKNAVAWEAEILLDLIPHYYDRPGRIVEILEGEPAKSSRIMVGQSFTTDGDGEPKEAADDHPEAKLYDLTGERFTVEISVGKSYPTRRAETEANLIDMMGANPQIAAAIAPLVAKYGDWPGNEEAFEVLKRLLWPPDMQGDGKDGQPNPQMLMHKLAEMSQNMQAMMQEMQKLQQIATGKVVEANAKIEVARIAAASAGAVAETKVNADLAEAIIDAEAKRAGIEAENARTMVDAASQKLDHAHDVGLQAHQHAHDLRKGEQDAAAAQALAKAKPKPNGSDATR